jgi:hypothetical protein
MHYSKKIKARCESSNIEIVFNATYSSEYNPAEVIWLLSKQIFRKQLISFTDYKNSLEL